MGIGGKCMSAGEEVAVEMRVEGEVLDHNALAVHERLVSGYDDPQEAELELQSGGFVKVDGLHSRSLERQSAEPAAGSSLFFVRWYSGLKAWRDPRTGKGIPRRPVFIGAFLFLIGLVFVFVFLSSWLTSGFGESYPYIVISAITLPPGSYALVVTYKSYHFEPGWNFGQIRGPND